MAKQTQLLLRDRDDVGPTDCCQPSQRGKKHWPEIRARQGAFSPTLRHGLTAETVIAPLEDAEDYKAFQEVIATDFDAQSAVERELVLRLAGCCGDYNAQRA
jgi:hypothetical protein